MGGSKKQTTGYWYTWAMHFGWCKGTVDAVLEWRAGGKTAWQGRMTASGQINVNLPNLWGGESQQGGVVGAMDILFGEATQAPSSYLGGVFGPQQSAHRGKLSTVFRGGKFGANIPNPQPVSLKVERILADWQDDVPWYPEKAAIPLLQSVYEDELGPISQGWSYLVVASGDTSDYSADTFDSSSWLIGQSPFAGGETEPYAEGAGFPPVSNTYWPLNTNIWVRRSFVVQNIADFSLVIFVDNYATVWVNGHLVLPRVGNAAVPSSAAFLHAFAVPAGILRQGSNTIALLAEDSGVASYAAFDIPSNSSQQLFAMNPVHMLYDSITHKDLQGEPIGLINDDIFRAAADQLYSEGFGLCTDYDSSAETPLKFQQRICNVIGANLSQSRIDGDYYLDLIRAAVDFDSLPIISEATDDIISFTQEPSILTETTNSVSVTWIDPQAKAGRQTQPVRAMGAVQAVGKTIAQTNDYPEIPIESLALRVAARDVKALSTPLSKMTLTIRHILRNLRPGLNFRLQMPSEGIADMVCVVGSIAHGVSTDGQVKIVAIQNVYDLPASVYVNSQPGLWSAPPSTASAPTAQIAFEAPFIELVQAQVAADPAAIPADAGYVLTAAVQPPGGLDYAVDTAAAGEAYVEYGTAEWCPSATLAVASDYGIGPFAIANRQQLSMVDIGTWALWDDEIVRIDALDDVAGTMTLGRGCADTVPALHSINSRIYFCGDWTGTDKRQYVGGDTVSVKLLTVTGSDKLGLDFAAAMSVSINDRQVRPYPPANLQFNGARFPTFISEALVITWSHRDRLLQADQLIDTLQSDIGPEPGTTYTVKVFLNNVLNSTAAGITNNTLTPTVSSDGNIRVEVTSQRAGVDCWQKNMASFAYTAVAHAALTLSGTYHAASVGSPYSDKLSIDGGITPYANPQVITGILPEGLALSVSGSQLIISGTPSTAETQAFSVSVDSGDGQTATSSQSIAVEVEALALLTLSGSYGAAQVGSAYQSDLTISGGEEPYTLGGEDGVNSGILPAGLALSIVGSMLRLSGIPTATETEAFSAGVTSSDGQTAQSNQSVAVTVPISGPPVSGYTFWLDASQLSEADGDTVMAWPDLSPSMTATVLEYTGGMLPKPVMRKTGFNSFPGVELASPSRGVQNYFSFRFPSNTITPSPTGATIFLIAKNLHSPPQSDFTSALPLGLSTGQSSFYGYASDTHYYDNEITGGRDSGGLPAGFNIGAPYSYSKVANSVGSSVRLNRSSLYTSAAVYAIPSGNIGIVGMDNNNNSFTGDSIISEIILYPMALSPTEIIAVENYLAAKWGTP